MKRIVKVFGVCTFLVSCIYFTGIVTDKVFLRQEIIRLHVVAQSDSAKDQQIKLQVKDAVVAYLQENMPKESGIKEAKAYLREHMEELEMLANNFLAGCDSTAAASVSLGEEAFPLRNYETFSLPAGVYESLRITIGSGEGKNWWCVVFPALCMGTTQEDYEDMAVSVGLSDGLIHATMHDEGYEIRFFFLDCLGKLENLFHFR